ncbi:MAG TPA: GAF domain-containing protein [Bdellovibrionota bacterium]|nr:GAF domain-containing protein [Bdellovibrionota bacterium]
MSDNDELNEPAIDTVLELPPAPDSPICGMGTLLSEDSLAATMAKLSVLESLIRLITRDCSFNDFVRESLVSIMRVIKCEAGSIFEIDYQANTLFFRSCVGQSSDSLPKFIIPLGQGIAGHVAESRQPLAVNDLKASEVHLKTIQDAVGFETRNLLAVPILIRGQVYGVLELLNRVGEDSFSSSDTELLNYFSDMLAKAFEARMMIAWSKQAPGVPTSQSQGEAA